MTREEQIIRESMKRAGIKSRMELSEMASVCDKTMYRKFNDPSKMTLGEFRRIIDCVCMSDNDILGVIKG